MTSSSEVTITNSLFANPDKMAALLFDARTKGQGALRVRVYKSGQQVAEDKVHLDLKPISEMYEHYTVGDTATMNVEDIPATATQIGTAYTSQSPEEKNYILFAHGWRMQTWERRAFAETAYKRMWHQGYKGRFGLYSWPTEWQSIPFNFASTFQRQNYDRSERKGWHSARGLRGVLQTLEGQYPGKVRVFSHSMGNILVGEALRQEAAAASPQQLVHTYVATQAASVAHAYDRNMPTILPNARTPNRYAFYPDDQGNEYFQGIAGIAGRYANFYNRVDYALTATTTWELNQRMKPDSPYNYRHVPGTPPRQRDFVYDPINPFNFRVLHIPADSYEIFAHADQARSRALGAQGGVRGPFDIALQVDLNTGLAPGTSPINFGARPSEHSAQFNYHIQLRRLYWKRLLETFFPP